MPTLETLDLASLYEAHARRVWRMLMRLGVPGASVEDAVQDVFLTAQERLDDFEGHSRPETWLLGIAVRVAANLRRTAKRRPTISLVDESLADPASPVDAKLQQERNLRRLEEVLSRLPGATREAVVLIDLEQLTAPEVAEVLQVNLNTVYSRLRLGRAALTRALRGLMEEAR